MEIVFTLNLIIRVTHSNSYFQFPIFRRKTMEKQQNKQFWIFWIAPHTKKSLTTSFSIFFRSKSNDREMRAHKTQLNWKWNQRISFHFPRRWCDVSLNCVFFTLKISSLIFRSLCDSLSWKCYNGSLASFSHEINPKAEKLDFFFIRFDIIFCYRDKWNCELRDVRMNFYCRKFSIPKKSSLSSSTLISIQNSWFCNCSTFVKYDEMTFF